MKKKIILVVGFVVAAVATWFLMRGDADLPVKEPGNIRSSGEKMDKHHKRLGRRSDGSTTKARKEIDAALDRIQSGKSRSNRTIGVSHSEDIESNWTDEDGNPWPEEQRILMRAVVDAAEAEDFAAVAALAKEVAKSENADLREQYIEELGWFGEQALVELTTFLSDPSDEVVDAARSQITDAYQEIESDAEKAAVYTLLSRAVLDSEMLESLSDELVAMDEVIALQAIADTISDGTPKAIEAAKAAYKSITDEDWSDIDAAEEWLKQNYVEDDDDDGDKPGDGEKDDAN